MLTATRLPGFSSVHVRDSALNLALALDGCQGAAYLCDLGPLGRGGGVHGEKRMERPSAATADDRVVVRNVLGPRDRHAEFARDVRDGLIGPVKEIPPKYFYDARGSDLFERVTALPEYYLTRAETEILEVHAADFVSDCPSTT